MESQPESRSARLAGLLIYYKKMNKEISLGEIKKLWRSLLQLEIFDEEFNLYNLYDGKFKIFFEGNF